MRMNIESTHASSKNIFRVRLVQYFVYLIFFLSGLSTGGPPAGDQLDPSWSAVLSWAISNGARFGHDIVFTFGPLGFLYSNASYYPDTYPWFLGGQAVLSALMAYPFAAVLSRIHWRSAVLLLALYVMWWPWLYSDALFLAYIAAGVALLTTRGSLRTTLLDACVMGVGIAILALMKFSFLLLSVAFVFLVSLTIALRRRFRVAAALAASYMLAMTAIWVISDQQVDDITAYLSNSFEMAAGYGAAMSLEPPPYVDLIGRLVLLAVLGGVLVKAGTKRADLAVIPVYALLACIAYIGWKSGFTRGDTAHTNWSLPVLAMLPTISVIVASASESESFRWPDVAFIGLVSVLAFTLLVPSASVISWVDRFHSVSRTAISFSVPTKLMERYSEEWSSTRAAYVLPEIADRVGDEPVDILAWEQGVLLLNGFNYRPRPVFQSYSAYTEKLALMNRSHFLRPSAPKWLILRIQSIDGRMPASEDGAALLAIFERYRVELIEDGYFLLRRDDGDREHSALPGIDYVGRFREWIDLPSRDVGKMVALAIDLDLSVRGKWRDVVARGTPVILDVRTSGNDIYSFRLIPRSAKAGFPLSPLIISNDDLVEVLAAGANVREVRQFRVRPSFDSSYDKMFKETFGYGFSQFEPMKMYSPDGPQSTPAK